MPGFVRLQQRCRQSEIQDQLELEPGQLHHALDSLQRINWFSGSLRILWPAIAHLAAENPGQTLRILDVATGAGDIPLGIHLRAKQHGIPVEVAGCDFNPHTVQRAQETAAKAHAPVSFFTLDALKDDLPANFDVITCSLFLHHLADSEAEAFLRRASQATRRLVLVNDLRRSQLGYWFAWIGTRVLTRSKVVHHDGPASVESAFTMDEVRKLAARAGLTGAEIAWYAPFRFRLVWRRS